MHVRGGLERERERERWDREMDEQISGGVSETDKHKNRSKG